VAVDTFFAGTLKGVGKIYIQTVLDCFSRYVWARLYTSPATGEADGGASTHRPMDRAAKQ